MTFLLFEYSLADVIFETMDFLFRICESYRFVYSNYEMHRSAFFNFAYGEVFHHFNMLIQCEQWQNEANEAQTVSS